ncbi:MAG: hypothetical protein R3F56_09840 [Planctomycetota bacterium]
MRHSFFSVAALLVLAGCSSLPTDIGGLMGSVTGLTGQVSKWAGALTSGNIADAALKQLAGFSGQAGNLGSALSSMLGGKQGEMLSPDAKQVAGEVKGGLDKMSGLKLEDLLKLAQPARQEQVDSFVGSSKQVTDLASKLKSMLGG